MDLVSLDLEYLRPPFEASFINHNLDYIRSGSGKNSKRRIFYNVSFETSELKAIQDLEDLLKSQGIDLPSEWNSSETLKFLYAEKFDLESAAEMIKTCLEWRANPRTSVIDERVLQLFELGVIYIWGLDAQYRPILIINLNKLKQVEMDEETEDIFKIALVIMFDIIRTYCFLPRKIENWIMIVDARGVQTIEADHIQSIVYLIRCCFPSTLERLFVITSLNFRLSHQNLIQSIADKSDLEDIQLIATSEINELQKYIPPESLEKKYGGECPNLETFWPPAKRNETYQRTSVTSLKQYSDSGSLKGNISTKRGNYDTTFGEFGKPNLFTENMDPKSIESSRVDQSKLQPNQLGLSSYSQGHPKKAHDAFNRNTYSGDNNIVESVLVTRSPTKFENVKNASQPQSAQKSMNSSPGKQKGNDPFQARKLEGEEVNTRNRLDTSNYSNRTSELPSDFFVTQVAEMPKNKPKNLWDGKVESLGYNRQLSNNPSIERSNSRAQSRRENDSGFYSRDRNLEASPPHQNHPYAGLGFQRENMRNLDGSPQNYGMYGTFEENDENATSRISYSQKDKEQIKRRLIEISAKKQEESDEEDAKSKKGLFCGCCVEKKKKARKSSRAKRSKYV